MKKTSPSGSKAKKLELVRNVIRDLTPNQLGNVVGGGGVALMHPTMTSCNGTKF